jgi:steroid delta-isomerase-like uncharacterized protein
MTATTSTAAEVAQAYFDAISAHDLDAAVALWAEGGREHVRGQVDTTAPDGVRAFLGGLLAAFPDLRFTETEVTAEGERAAVRWRARGTFAGAPFNGFEATGTIVDLEGVDVLTVRDGRIAHNDAFPDGVGFAQQIGALPARGTKGEARMTAAFNLRTRLTARLAAAPPEPVAEGVWVVRGGLPRRTMNVFLVRDGDGVLAFDAGIRDMRHAVAAAAASLGGLTRVVLGHAHEDHRGTAPSLGVPVLCHPADRADAEGDGGRHYFRLERLRPVVRSIYPHLLSHWDGGPVEIAGTVEEGDRIGEFEVVHLPGHAPGLIGLWRERDRLALCSDAFYLIEPQTGIPGGARVPHEAFNLDTEQARASIRKLAALGPAAAWPGHMGPLTGDVRGALEAAAAA